jgi:hypothetical protein
VQSTGATSQADNLFGPEGPELSTQGDFTEANVFHVAPPWPSWQGKSGVQSYDLDSVGSIALTQITCFIDHFNKQECLLFCSMDRIFYLSRVCSAVSLLSLKKIVQYQFKAPVGYCRNLQFSNYTNRSPYPTRIGLQ